MTKDLWPVQQAKEILSRYGDKAEVVFETGYGPSGLPHIGTFAEVARTCFVIEALKNLAPEKKIRLIAFSDDMDGLRKIPENIPNKEMLSFFLGMPLSKVSDPFGKEESYAKHMNNQLCEFLDSFGFEYEFKSSTDYYESGSFNAALKSVLENYDRIKKLFIQTISEEKREQWSPFFVICDECHKIYTTHVVQVNKQEETLEYYCEHSGDGYKSCGHRGSTKIFDGKVKVGWKVDWAVRWSALKVGYEMHGEDLSESVKLSSKICRILGVEAPLTYKYELFLDENGKKISKTKGNGISMEHWLRYAPFGALLYFLLGNPGKPKKMGLPILPKIVDEYFQALNAKGEIDSNAPLWYIQKFKKCSSPTQAPKLTYTLLQNVAESLGVNDATLLFDYAQKYDPDILNDREYYMALCSNVIDYVTENNILSEEIEPEEEFFPFIESIIGRIKAMENNGDQIDGDEMQKFLFQLAKENELNIREWFIFLYSALLRKTQGPKMGTFFGVLGKEKSLEILNGFQIRCGIK